MLEYDTTDVFEQKSNGLCKCIIIHYWYFLEITFICQSKVTDACHNSMQKAISFKDFVIVSVKENDFGINFW